MKKIIPFTIILMALTACTTFQVQTLETTGTEITQVNMPNPASVYCEQNGNELEIQTAADGSQSGVCVFPDGSTCDEWAYYRGECGPVAQISPTAFISNEATQKASNDGAGENASGGYMAPGTAEEINDWWGIIKSTESDAQYDDYFERRDLGGAIYFGIDSKDQAIKTQIEALRDSGKIVHLYGTLFSNVPDYNGSKIQVDHFEIEG
jgi:putative hemolysin